jgi:predicted Zn-dependent peptidase
VLGDHTGSRLYWELVDPGLAENADLSYADYEGSGLLATYMSCAPEQAEENLEIIGEVYASAESEGITPAELEQAKSKLRSRIVLSSERPRSRLYSVGLDWMYRREYRSIERDLETVASLRLEDILAVLARYPLSRSTTLTIGPAAGSASVQAEIEIAPASRS